MICPLCGSAADLGLTRVYCTWPSCTNYAPASAPEGGSMPLSVILSANADTPGKSASADSVPGINPVHQGGQGVSTTTRLRAVARDTSRTYSERCRDIIDAYHNREISFKDGSDLIDEARANPQEAPIDYSQPVRVSLAFARDRMLPIRYRHSRILQDWCAMRVSSQECALLMRALNETI